MITATTDAAFGDWGAAAALAAALRPDARTWRWLALHTRDPRTAPPNELFGLNYTRHRIRFSPPSARACANTNGIVFNGLPTGRIPWLGIWTDVAGGGLAAVLDISATPLLIGASGQVRLAIGDIAFRL